MRTNRTATTVHFLKDNLLILLIVCLAAWLRVWQLDTHGILFGDAGRDLLVAKQSLEDNSIPLLGIPSSVPRFKQGPVSIWIEMAVITVFGINTLAQSVTFALISIAAVIGVYELVCIYIDKKHAVLTALLLATSPLAVANGRVPYHTTPLPLATTLFLFAMMWLWQARRLGVFISSLAFALMFQFELTVAPLFLLIPFTLWWTKRTVTKNIFIESAGGLFLGLLPQLIFDLTHAFAQLGVFMLWIGHKLMEFATFQGGGSINFQNYFISMARYGGRIFSTDYWQVSVLILVLILFGTQRVIRDFRSKKLPPVVLLVELSLVLLMVGYFVHGSPSEAYYPPFFVLLPIHIAYTVFSLAKQFQMAAVGSLILLGLFNTYSIGNHSFFVGNQQEFSYGASVQEMKQVLEFVSNKSAGSYSLRTTAAAEQSFPSYFDNYRWLADEAHIPRPTAEGTPFFIESPASTIRLSSYMHRDFQTVRVYWQPFRRAE